MILRRLSDSLREQNWTAIVIEFVLLVLGVFLGIQVSNWNQARSDRADYQAALGRLRAEIDTNLADLDAFDPVMAQALATESHALDVLQSCVDSEENRRAVAAGLALIRGTSNLHPRLYALREMTSNPRLLSQQSPSERQRFSEMLYFFEVLQRTADFAEDNPEEARPENNPILRVGPSYESSQKYYGFDWTSKKRKLELAVPLDQACHDNTLTKDFFNWERRQGSLPVISRKWRAELQATKQLIVGPAASPRPERSAN